MPGGHIRIDATVPFYNQPLSIRFGTELLKNIDSKTGIEPFWDGLDIAVAWVRATGMAYLSDAFAQFLGHDGQLCFVVGIDLQNTSKEGLQALLDLETHGASETYVYHNERLCCTNRMRDSSRESSVVAAMQEQTYTPNLQDQELASL